MTAEAAARAVLDWCLDPRGAPPRGDLLDLERLLDPEPASRAALARAAAVTAARLGLGELLAGRPGRTDPGPRTSVARRGRRRRPARGH